MSRQCGVKSIKTRKAELFVKKSCMESQATTHMKLVISGLQDLGEFWSVRMQQALNLGCWLITSIVQTLPTKLSRATRSEEHTSELQSLMRISYAVFCLKKKNENTLKYD